MDVGQRMFLALGVVAAGLGFAAHAQDFPAKQPVKLIVTFAPGGGSDTIARTVNTKMGEALGHSSPSPRTASTRR